jgi:hypothetical protein
MSEIPLASQGVCRMTQGSNYPLVDEFSRRPYPVFPSPPASQRASHDEPTARASINVEGTIVLDQEVKHITFRRDIYVSI